MLRLLKTYDQSIDVDIVLYCIVEISWPGSPPEFILLIVQGGEINGLKQPKYDRAKRGRCWLFEIINFIIPD